MPQGLLGNNVNNITLELKRAGYEGVHARSDAPVTTWGPGGAVTWSLSGSARGARALTHQKSLIAGLSWSQVLTEPPSGAPPKVRDGNTVCTAFSGAEPERTLQLLARVLSADLSAACHHPRVNSNLVQTNLVHGVLPPSACAALIEAAGALMDTRSARASRHWPHKLKLSRV